MGKIVSAEKEFQRRRSQNNLKQLSIMIDRQNAEIEENPWPQIEKMNNKISQLFRVLKAVKFAANPLPTLVEPGSPICHTSIETDAYNRLIEVNEILNSSGLLL